MHKLEKAVLECDPTPHEHEEAVQALFTSGNEEAGGAIKEARAAGMTWPAIIALLVQYGPQFAAVLQAILAAWHQNPPRPVLAKAAAEELPEDHPKHPKHRHK